MTDQRPQIDPESVKTEAGFRATVLLHLQYISKDMEELKEGLRDHIEDDQRQFGKVEQRIGTNEGWINKGLGMIALLVAMAGIIMWAFDKVRP